MSFKTKGYLIIKNAISKELAKIAYNYLLIKRNAIAHMRENNYLAPFDNNFGTWNDGQVPNTFSIYGDSLMETLLLYVKPKMIKGTKLKLYETYSYARTYKLGDILKKHKDRSSCEISTTLFLGGNKWPIYLNDGKKDIKINLNEGDMLIYKGCDLEHWRKPFNGEVCVQVFLHYSTNKKLLNDTRPKLGLNAEFKNI
jgi:hypothetical protein|tara:strand:- start:1112 stop:1705 length:594 start_codon:yes stop_codon:yes gene_type:complete